MTGLYVLAVVGVLMACALLLGVVIGATSHRDRVPETEETDEHPPTWWATKRSGL